MNQSQGKISITFLVLSILLILGFALSGGGWFWWNLNLKPVDVNDKNLIAVFIPKDTGAAAIAQILQEKSLIKNTLVFHLYIKYQSWDKQLKAGRYQFSKAQSLPEIAKTFKDGVLQDFWVTVPEGKRREEIVKIFSDAFAKENLEFSIPDFLEESKDLEGYLFPDSYLIPRTMIATEIVDLMRKTFDQKVSDDLKVQASKQGLSFQEALIMASMVEREAKFEVDRPKIAGVFLNRFKIGMAMQVDATIQYALGTIQCQNKIGEVCNWWPVITDTKIKSTYNTYQNNGLPPTPICNPGLSVIKAVLNPDEHDYLYYLSEPSGVTHYAKSLFEHQANIEKYLN
jgi:UPF0755 protein